MKEKSGKIEMSKLGWFSLFTGSLCMFSLMLNILAGNITWSIIMGVGVVLNFFIAGSNWRE